MLQVGSEADERSAAKAPSEHCGVAEKAWFPFEESGKGS